MKRWKEKKVQQQGREEISYGAMGYPVRQYHK